MNYTRITIITVVYNGYSTLEASIKSVINQEKALFDYWIIDGGSTDGSIDIIQKYEHQLAGWLSEPDSGIYDAMNKGIIRNNCDWIYFLGADDLLEPNVLSKIQPYLSEPYKVVFGNVKFNNNYLFRSSLSVKTLMRNTLHHQGAFYHHSLFNDFRYDQFFPTHADYELNIRVYTQHLPTKYIPVLISTFAMNGKSSGHTEQTYRQINQIRKRYVNSCWKNAVLTFLLRLYFWQKQFRYWLYKHQV